MRESVASRLLLCNASADRLGEYGGNHDSFDRLDDRELLHEYFGSSACGPRHRCGLVVQCFEHHPLLVQVFSRLYQWYAVASKMASMVTDTDQASSNEELDAYWLTTSSSLKLFLWHWWCFLHQTQHCCNQVVEAASVGLGCNVSSRLYSIVLLLHSGVQSKVVSRCASMPMRDGTVSILLPHECDELPGSTKAIAEHLDEFCAWLLACFHKCYRKGDSGANKAANVLRVQGTEVPQRCTTQKHQNIVGEFRRVCNWTYGAAKLDISAMALYVVLVGSSTLGVG